MSNVRRLPVVNHLPAHKAVVEALERLVLALDVGKPSWRDQLDEARALLDRLREEESV